MPTEAHAPSGEPEATAPEFEARTPELEPADSRPVAVVPAAPVAEPVVESLPVPHAPQVIASFAAPPATYQVVSEHEKFAAEEAHRPVRRRQKEAAAAAPAEPLQLVETASDKAVAPSVPEEEPQRRPVRRRRHALASAAPQEPLQLVETAPGAATGEGTPPAA